MAFAVIAILLGVLLAGPYGIREQLHALGLKLDVALEEDLPWAIKRLKSLVVGRLIVPSVVLALAEIAWLWALYQEMPEILKRDSLASWIQCLLDRVKDANLKHGLETLGLIITLKITDTGLRLALASVFLLAMFAVWNYANGHLRRMRDRDGNVLTGEYDWELPHGIRTSLSLPHWWAVLTPMVWLVQGVYVVVLGIAAEDRTVFTLGLTSLAVFWAMGKVGIEVTSWLVLKGTGLAEWVLTNVPKLPGFPKALKDAIPPGGVNILEQEKIAAGLRKYWNYFGISWLPFAAATFWFTDAVVAIAFASATILASVFSLAMTSLGEGEKVEKATKDTTEFFWKWGKVITLLICGLGMLFQFSETARMSHDNWGNMMAGITPILVFTLKPGYYALIALGPGLVLWIIGAAFAKASGIWGKTVQAMKAFLALGMVYCIVAIVAVVCKQPSLGLARRYPATAENPVGLSTPTAQFRTMDNGKQDLVLTVFSRVKQAKGVVEFDEATAKRLGVPQQVPVRTFTALADCGTEKCRQHQVVVRNLTGAEAGSYTFVMRNNPFGQVEETAKHAFGPGSRVSKAQ